MSRLWNRINRYKLSVSSISQFDISASNSDDDDDDDPFSSIVTTSVPREAAGEAKESVIVTGEDEDIRQNLEVPTIEVREEAVSEERQTEGSDPEDVGIDVSPPKSHSSDTQDNSKLGEMQSSTDEVEEPVHTAYKATVVDEAAQEDITHDVDIPGVTVPPSDATDASSTPSPIHCSPSFKDSKNDLDVTQLDENNQFESKSGSDQPEGESRPRQGDVPSSWMSPRDAREDTAPIIPQSADFSTLDQEYIDALLNQSHCYDAVINPPGSYSSCIESPTSDYTDEPIHKVESDRDPDMTAFADALSPPNAVELPSAADSAVSHGSVLGSSSIKGDLNANGGTISSGNSYATSRASTASNSAGTIVEPTINGTVEPEDAAQNRDFPIMYKSYTELCEKVERMMVELGASNEQKALHQYQDAIRGKIHVPGMLSAKGHKTAVTDLHSEPQSAVSSETFNLGREADHTSADGGGHCRRQNAVKGGNATSSILHSKEHVIRSNDAAYREPYITKYHDPISNEDPIMARVGDSLLISRLAQEVEYYKQINNNLENRMAKIWKQHEELCMEKDRLAERSVCDPSSKTVRFDPRSSTDGKDNGTIVEKDTDIIIRIVPNGDTMRGNLSHCACENPGTVEDSGPSPLRPPRHTHVNYPDRRVPRGIRCSRSVMERVLSSGSKLHAFKLSNTGVRLQTPLFINVLSPQNSHSDKVVLNSDVGLFKLSSVNPVDNCNTCVDSLAFNHDLAQRQETHGPMSTLFSTIAGCVGLPWNDGNLNNSEDAPSLERYESLRSQPESQRYERSVQIRYMHSLVQAGGRFSMIEDSFLSRCNIAALYNGRHEQLFCVASTQHLNKLDMEGNPKFTFILDPSKGAKYANTKKFKGDVKILNSRTRHYLCIDLLTHELLFDDNRSIRPYSKYVVPAYFRIVPLHKLLMDNTVHTSLEDTRFSASVS
ncbi:hypothetical protein X943_001938 [Babesia divergens]|uniref:Uncharacterized protein n=1 Tax=Babesia divergens TaxID=32595 RepID=A0AAD9GHE9_BABDI|nr:hypothetical protein X943_001938 [Babesia divergens]